ncbi:MAG TPA: hypothetical protein VNO30_18610 [Kofleriaceae bacterium]|nr:hypothetical protein [Kofleriaceae bacterium]
MRSAVYSFALVLVASCYAPETRSGAPCTPGLANCPSGQTCELVAGAHVCVAGPVPDAGPGILVDAPTDGGSARSWTLVQTRGSNGQRVNIAATGAAHLIVVAVQTGLNQVASMTDDANNTYVSVAGSRAVDMAQTTAVELWYAASSNAGATTITASGDPIFAVVAWEVAGIRGANPLDTVSKLESQPQSTTPFGASITTRAAGEFVVSAVIVANAVMGVAMGSAFTNDHTTFGNGWAHLTSATAPAGTYQARWNQPEPGTSCATSAAFFTGP